MDKKTTDLTELAGGRMAIAKKLGTSNQYVYGWHAIPEKHLAVIVKMIKERQKRLNALFTKYFK